MEIDNHVIDLLPAYALDLLSTEETVQVAEHLSGCQTCQVELTRLQHVTDELPLALAQTTPPAHLKGKLMSTIRSRPARQLVIGKLTFWQRFTATVRRSAPAWALALIAVLIIGNLLQWSRINRFSSQAQPSMQVIALANTVDSPRAVGTLIIDQHGHYGTLVVDQLAELDPEHQYQVWLIQDGERTSGGLFSVNYAGYASLELLAPQPLGQYDAVGITIEPLGGSLGPTGAKVLGGDIPH